MDRKFKTLFGDGSFFLLLAISELGRTHQKAVFSLRFLLRPPQFPAHLAGAELPDEHM